MKVLLRNITYSIVALLCAQNVVGGFVLGENPIWTLFLLVTALFLLNLVMKPALAIIALPTSGISYFFLNFLLVAILMYVMALFIPGYSIVKASLPEMALFGIVLPAKALSPVLTVVYSALVFCLTFKFFSWLSEKK